MNWEMQKVTCTQTVADSNFSLPMLHAGWTGSSVKFTQHSVRTEKERLTALIYVDVPSDTMLHSTFYSLNAKKMLIGETANAVVISLLTKSIFINHSAL